MQNPLRADGAGVVGFEPRYFAPVAGLFSPPEC